MIKCLIIIASIAAFSCQNKESQIVPISDKDSTEISTANSETASQKVSDENQISDTLQVRSFDKNGKFTAEGSLDSINKRFYVEFKNDKFSKIEAKITPTIGKGNIRFNQIIYPDKTMDGPYGFELSKDLTQTGTYTLVIGRSLMAGDPFAGSFKVDVKIVK